MPEEAVTHSFQAEVSQVLHLVIHSLYSHKEIFLRELVSNASDALDKLRFRALTEPDLYAGDTTLAIRIRADRERKTLTIEDNGIGMTEEELVRDLGTVARSGSRAFLEQLAQRGQKDARLIGQFGVGFYSAYLVADRVEVVSRAAGAAEARRWSSEAKDTFTVGPGERATRGTAITLHLREDQQEFLDEWRLRDLVKRYSDYVSHPIQLFVTKGAGAEAKSEYETINRASALWQRPKGEITEDQYDEFYRHLAHSPEGEKPLARSHFKVEGTQEFAGLLYVPREKPFELRFGMKHRGVRLYVKRVLVMEDCEDIVPEWLRFIVGVIDSDDLPLNVSREVLQQSSAVRTIKKQLVKHALDALEALAAERPDDYATAWRAFGALLKQGVGSDFEYRDRLAKLLRYESTAGDGLHSLADYVKRMKDGQEAVYYVIGESRKALEGAPHLEGLRKRGYEVLFMTDPIDEWATESLRTFEGKPLVSAMRADLKIESTEDEKKARQVETEALRPLFERIRAVLGDRVTEVRASDRLTDSPCCLVLASAGPHGYVERLLREAGRDLPKSSRILELNPDHAIVRSLRTLVDRGDADPARVADWIEVLYDQALVAEGAPIADPGGFVRRITSLLTAVTARDGSPKS
jgi:molecular chaperone HtpG